MCWIFVVRDIVALQIIMLYLQEPLRRGEVCTVCQLVHNYVFALGAAALRRHGFQIHRRTACRRTPSTALRVQAFAVAVFAGLCLPPPCYY